MTQNASSRPKLTIGVQWPIASGATSAVTRLTANAQRNRTASSGTLAAFQRASGPIPMRNIAGAIRGTNTLSK